MNLETITPLIITFNEDANIERMLRKLAWASRIVVIDSGSTDRTRAILEAHASVEIVERPFDTFAGQCNFGLSKITTPWVLSLDADYVLSDDLVEEMEALPEPAADVGGYSASFVYVVHGRPLRATLYPPRTVLYRRAGACYADFGHGHRVTAQGRVEALRHPIQHDDRKDLSRWFASQQRYALAEADYLLSRDPSELRRIDRLRLMAWPAPLLILGYTLIAKRCLLDGWPGWLYSLQRTCAEVMIALAVLERRLKS
ncbi:MAG: glycosyltransferase family 2 protein [Burkholderiales bacterium]|nr:glycosyltransferase family 2 protein [Burkholderiales bacterium]